MCLWHAVNSNSTRVALDSLTYALNNFGASFMLSKLKLTHASSNLSSFFKSSGVLHISMNKSLLMKQLWIGDIYSVRSTVSTMRDISFFPSLRNSLLFFLKPSSKLIHQAIFYLYLNLTMCFLYQLTQTDA